VYAWQKILNDQVVQSVPEYEDCVRLAKDKNVSLAEIYKSAYQVLGGE
jgi:uncharacterized protein (DUF111 family)